MTKQAQTNEELPTFLNRTVTKGKPTKGEERAAIDAAIAAGKAITTLAPAKGKAKKARKEATQAKPAKAKPAPKAKAKKGKAKAEVAKGPVKGSVVPATFKAKAGKTGIMNADDLGLAIKNAFLSHGSNDKTPQESAREAVDELLQDNGLDVGRWAGKNPGMLRMNVTNVLRAIRRNGESVIVRGKTFKAA